MDKHGKFGGNLDINVPKLLDNLHLVVTKNGRTIMNRKNVPKDLTDLLTKRYNPKANYSQEAIELFRKIAEYSGLSKTGRGTGRSMKSSILLVDKPSEVLEKLDLLLGSKEAGNDSIKLNHDIQRCIDYLLKHNLIDPAEHKKIFALVNNKLR